MTNYWFSYYKMYLACPEQYRLHQIVGLPYELSGPVKEKVEEGDEIHEKLRARLNNISKFKAGNSKLLKQYHELYKVEDEAAGPWLTESTWPPVEIAPGLRISAKPDAFSQQLRMVRDTKVKSRRGFLALDVVQLMWYCIVLGVSRGQLDLIYPPSWERSDWGLERLDYEFTGEQRLDLCADICKFHAERERLNETERTVRNPKSCDYCTPQYQMRCWGELIIK